MNAIRTTCPYCGVGCGISATPGANRSVDIAGDLVHPANAGKLCSKGTHLAETVGLEGRLLYPEIKGERSDWDSALTLVADRFSRTIAEHGPDSVAFYVSGQLLTEDYYVANKLMKGFIGSANIDTNSRLCMASAVAAHNRAFGEDIVPCSYDDLAAADLILLVGSNTAWCHPVIWQQIEAARAERGTKLVVIDPRRTETAAAADLHLAIRPDGDVALFNALLKTMHRRGAIDEDYLAAHVDLPDDFWSNLKGSPEQAGISSEEFETLAEWVCAIPRLVTLFSQGANQSVQGTDKGNAIINLHLATGRIGAPGAGPFSITGQPNAMGGREVGGLATMLAAHMGFSDEEKRTAQEFWQSPTIAPAPGRKAVDMFRDIYNGKIKALWVMATNPAVSMPDAGFVREALGRCDFLAVSDVMQNTDTGAYADVKLPALAWAEKDGMVTNSERVVSRQRALFAPPGEAKPDWLIINEVAAHMGFAEAFAASSAADIFREYCAQTGYRNDGQRLLDMSSWSLISDADYAAWRPQQWGGRSPFAEGRYSTASGRAQMITTEPSPVCYDDEFPLCLNSGRYRDQWHTMTRTGLSSTLSQHLREPLVVIHPDDAARFDIADGALTQVIAAHATAVFRAQHDTGQRLGELFVPMHWTDQHGNIGRANMLADQRVDPISGQPGFKNGDVRIAPLQTDWKAFLVTRETPDIADHVYWTASAVVSGLLYELAGQGAINVEALLPAGQRMEAFDSARGTRRIAVMDDAGRLAAALFLTRSGELPSREWIVRQLQPEERPDNLALLAGRAPGQMEDAGPTVCVCFNVGTTTLLRGIAEQSLTDVDAVGKALSAGTNCGSCRPAIAALLDQVEQRDREIAVAAE
ncbi:MAG: molybdopterin-dependent oxidoreductase [Pseudomonadota bacterium]